MEIGNQWDAVLKDHLAGATYHNLWRFLEEEYATKTVYPPIDEVFSALRRTLYQDVRVVIIGQDPYHSNGQANGLAFSVKPGTALPPSLKNIYKECQADTGFIPPSHGDLSGWSAQGVLLLNRVLTVVSGKPNSHKNKGWEGFTAQIIRRLNLCSTPIVFMLWGNNAKACAALITNPHHLVLQAAHPSPLSAYNGFFGCRHFSKAQVFLKQSNTHISWQL